MKIIECQMFESYSGTGIAVLTSAFRFFLVNNVDEPKLWRAAEISGEANLFFLFFIKRILVF